MTEIPEVLETKSPAEVLEYHTLTLKNMGAIPKEFKLSDSARRYILAVIHTEWGKENSTDKITSSIFGFLTGFYMGRNT